MIKLVIFDLDGVLADSRDLHFHALNEALELYGDYAISREEHLAKYDGRSTSVKLKMLTEEKGLPVEWHKGVWENKQRATIDIINETVVPNEVAIEIFSKLKNWGFKIAVASNSIRETVRVYLHKLGLIQFVDYYYSNEDVRHPKPSPEMYLKAMIETGCSPKETVIVEDSHIGRQAVYASGAYLCAVRNVEDVTLEKITLHVSERPIETPKWQGGKMNVVIPMAGLGSRFAEAGYIFPKPLIETIDGKPMIQLVVENLNIDARHIFIVQKEHCDKYNLKQLLRLISPGCEIIELDGMTEGAACTLLKAKEFINNDEPLLLANSDQFVEWNSNQFMYSMIGDTVDGGILTFTATHPKWSFAKLDQHGFVSEVAEKNPISDIATVGIYYWTKGSDFVKYAEQMIDKNIRVNGEFYTCPVFNEAIQDGKKIKTFHIDKMHGLGTPQDLETFLSTRKN